MINFQQIVRFCFLRSVELTDFSNRVKPSSPIKTIAQVFYLFGKTHKKTQSNTEQINFACFPKNLKNGFWVKTWFQGAGLSTPESFKICWYKMTTNLESNRSSVRTLGQMTPGKPWTTPLKQRCPNHPQATHPRGRRDPAAVCLHAPWEPGHPGGERPNTRAAV